MVEEPKKPVAKKATTKKTTSKANPAIVPDSKQNACYQRLFFQAAVGKAFVT